MLPTVVGSVDVDVYFEHGSVVYNMLSVNFDAELPSLRGTSAVYRRGEVNDDGAVNAVDAVHLLDSLFPVTGATPVLLKCADASDCNADGVQNLLDPVALLTSLFGASIVPLPPPANSFGKDALIGCTEYDSCP